MKATSLVHLGALKKPFLHQSDAVDKLDHNWHHLRVKFLCVLSLLAFVFVLVGCRDSNSDKSEEKEEETKYFQTSPEKVPELATNRLANEPTSFLRNQASSAINWQPWSAEATTIAEKSQRILLVLVGSSAHPFSTTVAEILSEEFADEINSQYVPVLADIEADPALAIGCYALALERRTPITFPLFLWMTHEGNPVTSITINTRATKNDFIDEYRLKEDIVKLIQEKSMKYVVEHSRFVNDQRTKLITSISDVTEEEKKLHQDSNPLFLSAQLLTSLYDSTNNSFDNTGGIPPGNLITTLGRIGQHPACSSNSRKEIEEATQGSVENLVESAIRDPLDNYFFSRRASRSFDVPSFSKILLTQSEMLSAMSSSSSTPASRRASKKMVAQITQKPFVSSSTKIGEDQELAYFWSEGDLSNLLTKEEFEVVKTAFDIRPLGNISSNDDVKRRFLRLNSLGLNLSGGELARAVGKKESTVESLLTSACQKIKEQRDEILTSNKSLIQETTNTLDAKARLLTALTRFHSSNPDATTLKKINTLGEKILSDFRAPDGSLLRIPAINGHRAVSGYAYDYASTIEALLEWYRLTWNPELMTIARQLTTLLLDNFVNEQNQIVEIQVTEHPLNFTIFNFSMIFGPTTWGTCYGILNRMSSIGFEHPKLDPVLSQISPYLQKNLKVTPVIHTDYLLFAVNNVYNRVLVLPKRFKSSQSLREKLATAKFDGVFTVVEDIPFDGLPASKRDQAVLFEKGEIVATYSNDSQILNQLPRALSKR